MFAYLMAADLPGQHRDYLQVELPEKPGCLDRVANTPSQGFGGIDAYPGLLLRGAAYIWFVVNGHCFMDGNKRLGWIAGEQFLYANGFEVDHGKLTNEAMADNVLEVSQSQVDVESLAEWLKPFVVDLQMS